LADLVEAGAPGDDGGFYRDADSSFTQAALDQGEICGAPVVARLA
jgi:hypothetical protein